MKLLRSFIDWMTTHEAKYSLMLVIFLLMFIMQPTFAEHAYGGVIIEMGFSLMIISSIHVTGKRKGHYLLFVVAGLITIVSQWSGDLLSYNVLKVISYSFSMAVLLLAIVSILLDIIRSSSVLYDTIAGAVCVYLLMGMLGGVVFTLLEFVSPDSFSFPADVVSPGTMVSIDNRMQGLIYFSYATLTTVGYGDIAPVKPLARSLSVLLAICGQLYLTVVMAVLIGVFLKDRSPAHRSFMRRDDHK